MGSAGASASKLGLFAASAALAISASNICFESRRRFGFFLDL